MFSLVSVAVSCFVDVVKVALPVAVVFEFGNLIVSTLLRAAFGGRLWLGR